MRVVWGITMIIITALTAHAQDNTTDRSDVDIQLIKAAENGNIDKVKALIKQGANIDTTDNNRATPLHWASANGHKDTVSLLIGKGADIDAADNNRATPLHWASANGHKDTVSLLIGKGADIDAADNNRATPLHWASANGHKDTVSLLIGEEADIDAKNNNGGTPLHDASWKGHIIVVKLLVDKNGDIDARDNNGFTPLHYVIESRYSAALDLANNQSLPSYFSSLIYPTALHLASNYQYIKHIKTAETLIYAGVDVNAKSNGGETPLHRASAHGLTKMALFLLRHGAAIHARDNTNETPLHEASEYGRVDTAMFLMQNGARVNARDINGNTPLHLASQNGHARVAKLLIDSEAKTHTILPIIPTIFTTLLPVDLAEILPVYLTEILLDVTKILPIDREAVVNAKNRENIVEAWGWTAIAITIGSIEYMLLALLYYLYFKQRTRWRLWTWLCNITTTVIVVTIALLPMLYAIRLSIFKGGLVYIAIVMEKVFDQQFFIQVWPQSYRFLVKIPIVIIGTAVVLRNLRQREESDTDAATLTKRILTENMHKVLRIFVHSISGLLILAAAANTTPQQILAGAGAAVAASGFLFQRFLMGFIANIHLRNAISKDSKEYHEEHYKALQQNPNTDRRTRRNATPILLGDWVEFPSYEVKGKVEAIGLRTMHIRSSANILHSVPLTAVNDKNWRILTYSDNDDGATA